MIKRILCGWLITATLTVTPAIAAETIQWQEWSDGAFKTAAEQHKLVLLDLGAVWCHWCHVMDETTYSNKDVISLIGQHYIALRVDQDSNPALSHRYEDYGWPATILFKPDGTEITKRRGYIEPAEMQALLKETFENPAASPGQTSSYSSSTGQGLTSAEHDMVLATTVYFYDQQYAGWGEHQKFLDPNVMEFSLNETLAGIRAFKIASEKSLDASYNLIDPVWGGVYQYSDMPDWKSPHFEKILSIQSTYLLSYGYAYGVFKDSDYKRAAGKVIRYLDAFMTSPDGAFYTSQDADVSEKITGHDYYPLKDEQRRKLGMPHIDRHIYASENGAMISALLTLYSMTGDEMMLQKALRAADWLRMHRALPEEGGFTHGEQDNGGPFLADTLATGRAMLDLYAATADRVWLARAQSSARFILAHFADVQDNGFFTADPKAAGVLKPFRQMDENLAAARFFNLLSYYTHDKKLKESGVSALRSVASPEQVRHNSFHPGLLLADNEIKTPPLHLTIVGRKDDPSAKALFKTALAVTPLYKQTEWLDKREGNLPGSSLDYPDLPKAAAFVCTDTLCSPPVYDAKALNDEIDKLH